MTKYDGDRDSSVGSLRPVEDEVIPSVLISKALNCIAISDPEGLEILLDRSEGIHLI